MTPELARLRKTFDSPSCACPLRGAAVVNQAPAKSAPGLGPSGFHPHASGLRPARSACRSFQGPSRLAQQPSVGSGRPNGLSAATPCLQGAFAAYPHSLRSLRYSTVPLHAAWLWIVRAYRVLPKAAEQIHPAVARFHSQRAGRHPLRGCCFEKRLFPAPKRSALKQICKSACGQALWTVDSADEYTHQGAVENGDVP